jgi:hypothetical protein
VYLQGSYANDTNIRESSDIDLVLQLNSIFDSDVSALSQAEREQKSSYYSSATYTLQEFKDGVIDALKAYFGAYTIRIGNKSIIVREKSGRAPADVIVCNQYRKYRNFSKSNTQDYVEGIKFYTKDGNYPIINYPKNHIENGRAKNKATDGRYKPMVRMFKSARDFIVDNEIIDTNKYSAPSYFLECLMYNVPNKEFVSSKLQTYYNVIKWLNEANISVFNCQNEQLSLFGSSSTQWDIDQAKALIQGLIKIWNEWDDLV